MCVRIFFFGSHFFLREGQIKNNNNNNNKKQIERIKKKSYVCRNANEPTREEKKSNGNKEKERERERKNFSKT